MNQLHLSLREQSLSALIITVIILGGYSVFRFIPANQQIINLQQKASKTQNRLLKARIPEQPLKDSDKLTEELAQLKQEIALITEMSTNLTQHMAPFDSQALKLEISQLARDSNVFIRINKKMKGAKVKDRRPKKNNRKPNKKVAEKDLILPESAGWIARMSPGTLLYRPMQRLQLEGSYQSIRKFIRGLRDLSYQVTVLKIRIDKSAHPSPVGYPQTLVSELVLAL